MNVRSVVERVARGVDATSPIGRFSLTGRPERQDVRRWIRGALAPHVDVHTLVDVLLVAGELIGNAYQHTTSPQELRLAHTDFGVLVEVADGETDHPEGMTDPDKAWGNRGVQVLKELAAAWGVRVEHGGKVVWALLPMVETKLKPRSG